MDRDVEELAKQLFLADLGGWAKLPGTSWEEALEETREYWREQAAGSQEEPDGE